MPLKTFIHQFYQQMKIINTSLVINERSNPKEMQIQYSRKGITERLLEKYKSKSLYKVENLKNREDNKRVA